MLYILSRNGCFYFNRRVPESVRHHYPKDAIRFSLKTRDRKRAVRLAMTHNDHLEAYWRTLITTGTTSQGEAHKAVADRARLLGFPYLQSQEIASLPLESVYNRLTHVARHEMQETKVEAVLGKYSPPSILLSEVAGKYFDLAKDKTINKSVNQLRKWQNPRILAMNNFIQCVGNKPLHQLTREDALKFRDWWIERIKNENLVAGSANKYIIYIKTMMYSIVENLQIPLDAEHVFKKLLIVEETEKRRLPFETSYLRSTLLNHDNLAGLNEQARWVVFAFAETGAGLNELTGLLPEDIILDAEIPHIHIRARKGRALKTKFRQRTIPLVGFALDAFNALPEGFAKYHDRPDGLSGLLSQYFKNHNLLPTDQHTVYSLRHSFQDRLLAVNTPDRIQADLMGHKFGRPRYGDGATLAHKLEWMQKICLKIN